MLKLLVFDLDGTLVDTRKDLASSVNHALKESGFSPLPLETVIAGVGDGAQSLIERALAISKGGRHPETVTVETVLTDFLNHYTKHCIEESQAYPGVSLSLELLKGYKMAVLTNKPLEPARKILEGLDLDHYFEFVVGGDNPFGKKPNPMALKNLMSQAEAEPAQTIMIGDGIQDFQVAGLASTHFLAFLSGMADRNILMAEKLEAVIDDMHFLPQVLANMATNKPGMRGLN